MSAAAVAIRPGTRQFVNEQLVTLYLSAIRLFWRLVLA
jgi:hypothetical protein